MSKIIKVTEIPLEKLLLDLEDAARRGSGGEALRLRIQILERFAHSRK